MMSREQREYLGELYREQDQLMLEHREWLAEREAVGGSPMRKSQPDHGLLYRSIDDALVPAPEPEPAASDSEYPPLDTLLRSLGEAMSEYVHGKLAERDIKYDRELALLRNENAELRGMIGTVLQLIGKPETVSNKAANVVDLPKGRGHVA